MATCTTEGPKRPCRRAGFTLEVHGQLICGVRSPLVWEIITVTLLIITPLISTHEPPSTIIEKVNLFWSRVLSP